MESEQLSLFSSDGIKEEIEKILYKNFQTKILQRL